MKLPDILYKISDALLKYNAKPIIVGGSVRDHFFDIEAKDFDIEVFSLDKFSTLESILSKFGKIKLVGKSFGVVKFIYKTQEYDFSFPRREKKIASGHRGFDVSVDGSMSYAEASIRRDFTINSIGYDIQSKEFLDPNGGMEDLKNRTLRHINSITFIEDPLRVYRAVQFCARFELKMHPDTKKLCKEMVEENMLEELPKERVFEEIKKLLLKAKKPSIGFSLMKELGILRYFPQLKALIGVEQEKKYHPEGDVWIHTLLSLDAMAGLRVGDQKRDIVYMLAVLCHDFGKPMTTKKIDGRVRALGHEEAGVEPTMEFLSSLSNEQKLIESILPLVRYHLAPSNLFRQKASPKAIRRLATKVNIEDLVIVAKADFLGRETQEARSKVYKAGEWLIENSQKLGVKNSALIPLIQGRDLIKLGLKPSAEFKKILDTIYEKQINGDLNTYDEAISFIKNNLL
jgi:tRNA nucleotidyltransferase (CCA-adding enzyme)